MESYLNLTERVRQCQSDQKEVSSIVKTKLNEIIASLNTVDTDISYIVKDSFGYIPTLEAAKSLECSIADQLIKISDTISFLGTNHHSFSYSAKYDIIMSNGDVYNARLELIYIKPIFTFKCIPQFSIVDSGIFLIQKEIIEITFTPASMHEVKVLEYSENDLKNKLIDFYNKNDIYFKSLPDVQSPQIFDQNTLKLFLKMEVVYKSMYTHQLMIDRNNIPFILQHTKNERYCRSDDKKHTPIPVDIAERNILAVCGEKETIIGYVRKANNVYDVVRSREKLMLRKPNEYELKNLSKMEIALRYPCYYVQISYWPKDARMEQLDLNSIKLLDLDLNCFYIGLPQETIII